MRRASAAITAALLLSSPVRAGEAAPAAKPATAPVKAAPAQAYPSWFPPNVRQLANDPKAVEEARKSRGSGGVTLPAPGQCPMLPKQRPGPFPWPTGETLDFDVDVMGVRAGKITMSVLPATGSGASMEIPVRATAESNTFFNKVRRVKAEVVSYLKPKDLHPHRFHESTIEGDLARTTNVNFDESKKLMEVDWRTNSAGGSEKYAWTNDALDYVGGFYLMRALPLKVGEPICFESYALHRLWRVEGKVEAKEHVSTPAGEFDTFHISGVARRMSGAPMERQVHVWISDDARRIPVATLGMIDLGVVRATLSSLTRSDVKAEAAKPGALTW